MSTKSKRCPRCKDHKPLKEFYKRVLSKDGLSFWCKDCSKKCVAEYYQNNREKVIEASRIWIQANREQHNRHSRNWARKNADKISIINARAYRKRKALEVEAMGDMTFEQITKYRHYMNGRYRSSDGITCYVICGEFHRENGPAIYNDSGSYTIWFINDKQMTEEEFKLRA